MIMRSALTSDFANCSWSRTHPDCVVSAVLARSVRGLESLPPEPPNRAARDAQNPLLMLTVFSATRGRPSVNMLTQC